MAQAMTRPFRRHPAARSLAFYARPRPAAVTEPSRNPAPTRSKDGRIGVLAPRSRRTRATTRTAPLFRPPQRSWRCRDIARAWARTIRWPRIGPPRHVLREPFVDLRRDVQLVLDRDGFGDLFDPVEWEHRQIAERRIPDPKVVERDRYAQIFQLPDHQNSTRRGDRPDSISVRNKSAYIR